MTRCSPGRRGPPGPPPDATGPVGYREYGPAALPVLLRGPVECAWRGGAADPTRPQRILPDGGMDLILLAEPHDQADPVSVLEQIVVAGPDTHAHLVTQPPDAVATGLRFHPGALPTLLGVPAAALRDRRVGLVELLDRRRGRELRDRTAAAHPGRPSTAGAVLVSAAAILRTGLEDAGGRTGRDPAVPILPAVAVHRLGRGAEVGATAAHLGVGVRTLHRWCRDAVGYGPATLRRILRFRRAVALLDAGYPLATVAAAAGYADQPHLSREVKALAGLTPHALRAAHRPEDRPRPDPSGDIAGAPDDRERAGPVHPRGANRSTAEPSGSRTVA